MNCSNIVQVSKQHVTISPNGEFFVTMHAGKIILFDCLDPLIEKALVIPVSCPFERILISPDSKLLAAMNRHEVVVYSVKLKAEVAKTENYEYNIIGIIWAPTSLAFVLFFDPMLKCSIYDLKTRRINDIKGPKDCSYKCICAFNDIHNEMALLQRHGIKDYVVFYNYNSWQLTTATEVSLLQAVRIQWTPNGEYVVVLDQDFHYKFEVIHPSFGTVFIYSCGQTDYGICDVFFSKDSTIVGFLSKDNKIRLFNSFEWKDVAVLSCNEKSIKNTNLYLQLENDKGLRLRNKQNYEIPLKNNINTKKRKTNKQKTNNILQISASCSYLACKTENAYRSVWILNLHTLCLETVITLNAQICDIQWKKQCEQLYILPVTGMMIKWSRDGIYQQYFFKDNGAKTVKRCYQLVDNLKPVMYKFLKNHEECSKLAKRG